MALLAYDGYPIWLDEDGVIQLAGSGPDFELEGVMCADLEDEMRIYQATVIR